MMKKHWEIKKLGEVCDFINRGISPKYHEKGGVCVINQKCIRDHRVNYDLARRHDCDAKIVSSERFIQVGDVLVNSTGTGTLGRVAQVRETPPEKTTVDSHITIVRPAQDKFYQDFFGYALIVIEEAIKESGEGCGGQTELARSVLSNNFSVSFPTSIPEQQRIVAILDEAFAAIATAKENAEKNLQNARELFESYLQSVFANPGDGWEEKTLGEVCSFEGGSQPSKDYFIYDEKEGYIRLIQIRDYKTDDKKVYIPIDRAKRFCDKNEIMIGRYGPPVFQILRGIKGAYNVALMKAIPNEKIIEREFMFFYLQHRGIQQYIINLSQRAVGQTGISREDLEAYPIYFPNIKKQSEIAIVINALSAETKKLEDIYRQKLNDLDELKKSVLQKAFNGDI